MNKYILKQIQKDRKINDSNLREDIGVIIGIIGIFLNLLLAVSKILIGISTYSISIIADAVNNAFDTALSVK